MKPDILISDTNIDCSWAAIIKQSYNFLSFQA